MASAYRDEDALNRPMRTAARTLSENHTFISEFRATINMMTDIAVEFEKYNDSQKVTELENALLELMGGYEDCRFLSSAVQEVGNKYKPGPELTDFKKALEDEFTMIKNNTQSDAQKGAYIRKFKEAVWNVHHSGQPMPGEELEDIVMTSTQSIVNSKCPISGKPVIELEEPVRSKDCGHVYEKKVIMHFIKRGQPSCPVAGCRAVLCADRVVCDPMLMADIEELRCSMKEGGNTQVFEDFTTELSED